MKEICGECNGTFDGEEAWQGDYWICPHCDTCLQVTEL